MANIFDEPVNPELFAGKTFYIAAGLFKEYEDKLISDIQVRRERVLRTFATCHPSTRPDSSSSFVVCRPMQDS